MLIDERHPLDEAYVIVYGTMRVVGTVEGSGRSRSSARLRFIGGLVFFDERTWRRRWSRIRRARRMCCSARSCSASWTSSARLRHRHAQAHRRVTSRRLPKAAEPARDLHPTSLPHRLAYGAACTRMLGTKDRLVEASDDDGIRAARRARACGRRRTDQPGDFIQRQRGIGYAAVGRRGCTAAPE